MILEFLVVHCKLFEGNLDKDSVDMQRRSGFFIERDGLGGGDLVSLGNVSLNRSQVYPSQLQFSKKDDCIQLKVHGMTEAGQAITRDLVRVFQNKLDDTVLEDRWLIHQFRDG